MQDADLDSTGGGLRFRWGCRGLDGTDRGQRRGGHAKTAETAAGEDGFVQ
jgi:hypothetical protein